MTPIYFLLLPDTLLLDAIGPAEVFAYANRLIESTDEHFQLHFIGPNTAADNSLSLHLTLNPLPTHIEKNAWLFVPGLVGSHQSVQTESTKKSIQWIQNHSFERIISVCSGALLLAASGTLYNKRCTTHFQHIQDLKNLLTDRQVVENRLFVEDGNVFTSAGVTSGIDLALYLVQQTRSPLLATEIAQNMVLFTRRGSQDNSHSPWLENRNHLHSKIHKVQDAIQANPAKEWSLRELANIANCGERHLVRLFKMETQLTTKAYIYKLRMILAKQLLQETQLSIEDIANRCGFNDDRQFRRLWGREHSTPPSTFR